MNETWQKIGVAIAGAVLFLAVVGGIVKYDERIVRLEDRQEFLMQRVEKVEH